MMMRVRGEGFQSRTTVSSSASKRRCFENFVNPRTRRRLMSLPKLARVCAKSDESTPISIIFPIQLVDPWWNHKIVRFHELKHDFNNHDIEYTFFYSFSILFIFES